MYIFMTCVNIQHIYCYCIKELLCSFPLPLLILICFVMALLIIREIRPLLTKTPLGVPDTQVTVISCGPVVHFLINIYFDSIMVTDPSKKSLNAFEKAF